MWSGASVRRGQAGFSQTETCWRLSLVNGSRVPAGPAVAEAHAGELGHQVELGRPDVAERDRVRSTPAVDALEVVRDRAPGRRRRTRRCPSASSLASNTTDRSPGGSSRSSGRTTSITKQPPGSRCAAAFRKQATCAVLGGEVHDRVEDEVDEARTGPRPCVVVMSPIVTPIASPPGLARSRATIALDSSIPCHGHAARGQRHRDAPGPDRELERAARPGKPGEDARPSPRSSRDRTRRR